MVLRIQIAAHYWHGQYDIKRVLAQDGRMNVLWDYIAKVFRIFVLCLVCD